MPKALSDDDRRSVINFFRTTEKERRQIKLKAIGAGVSMSEYLRLSALGQELPDPHQKLKERIEKESPKTETISPVLAAQLKGPDGKAP